MEAEEEEEEEKEEKEEEEEEEEEERYRMAQAYPWTCLQRKVQPESSTTSRHVMI